MKIENKICIYFMAPLLLCVMLIFVNLFFKQSGILWNNYTENCKKQTVTIAQLSTADIVEKDFVRLNNNISRLKYQKDIIKAIITGYPDQDIMAFTEDDDYIDIFRTKNTILGIEGDSISCKEYIDASNSKPIFQVIAPILDSKKRLATLMIFFDGSHLVQQRDDLKRKLLFEGSLVFVVGVALILTAGKITGKSYLSLLKKTITKSCPNLLKRALTNSPIDVFDLPELTLDTIVNIKEGTDINRYRFSPAEKKIINLISSEEYIHDILKKSRLDEILTFELISRLVNRGILENR